MSKEYTCLGMMSGTSGDGVDASIIKSNGQDKFTILREKYYEYEKDLGNQIHVLKKKINNLNDLNTFELSIKELEKKITMFHVKAAQDISSGFDLDLVGFHGQTLYHNPNQKTSIQIGNGNLLSQMLKKKVVFNFRKNDIRNGGEGAPLTPIFHKHIIKSKKINFPASVLNIGGISNISLIYNDNDNDILSKDIGPGNCLIDSWIRSHTDKMFDDQGKISARGKVNELILEQALEAYENNLKKFENVSLDTKDFDISFVRGLSLEDGAATLTSYTAKIISSNILSFLEKFNNNKIKILICGGGRKNLNLINQIENNSPSNLIFYKSEDYGLNGDFIESQAFGYLAIRSLLSLPISFPKTTRCSRPSIGGEIIDF